MCRDGGGKKILVGFPLKGRGILFKLMRDMLHGKHAHVVIGVLEACFGVSEPYDQFSFHRLDFTISRAYNDYTFMRKFFASLLEVLEVAVIAVVAVFIVRTFLVQPFLVSGASMSPNFSNGDYVLVDELTYHLRSPERGEVVVFHDPQDYSTYFIKRVIGLPGEHVTVKNNEVTVTNPAHPQGLLLNQ